MKQTLQTRIENIEKLRRIGAHSYYLYASEMALLACKGPYSKKSEAIRYAEKYLVEGQRWVVRNIDDEIVAHAKKRKPLEGYDYEE